MQRLFIGETKADNKKRKGMTNNLLYRHIILLVYELFCLEKT
jgi:hypothetical protein